MAKLLKDLQDERGKKVEEADRLVTESEKRDLTPEEKTQFSSLTAEIRSLDGDISLKQQMDAFQAGRSGFVGAGEDGNRDTSPGDQRDLSKYSLNRALLLKAEGRALDGIEAEVQDMCEKRAVEDNIELQGNGIVIMDDVLQKRGQTATLQTTNLGDQGGVLIEKRLMGVLEVLQANTFLNEVGARFLTGLTGNLTFPVQDTVPSIQELTEIEQMIDAEILFSTFEMTPNRRGTTVPISRQLLRQSSIDMQNFVINAIGEALAQKQNVEAIVNLLSIITTANGNLIELGTNGAAPSYANIVALKARVDGYNHLRGAPKFLTNSKVQAQLELTQKFSGTNGDPAWKDNGTMAGFKAVTSNIVPSNIVKGSANNASAILFGNFSDYIVGHWGGTEYIIDPYTPKKKAQIEVTANAFWNLKAARVKSFSGIKDALTPLS